MPEEDVRRGSIDGIDMKKKIINRALVLTDAEKRFTECMEEAVAAVLI